MSPQLQTLLTLQLRQTDNPTTTDFGDAATQTDDPTPTDSADAPDQTDASTTTTDPTDSPASTDDPHSFCSCHCSY